MAAEWFFGKKESVIIRNGIDVKRFSYDVDVRKQYRKALGLASEETVIGHVGRFTSEKNHSFILEVFAQYRELNNQAKLMLIGKGPLMEAMKQKVEQMDLQENVLFMGERSDVAEQMQTMDVFLMPSLFEGLPFVLVEAQAAGLPCLIADTINKDIVITDAVHYMSLSDTTSAWAEKLDDIVNNSVRVKNDALLDSSGYSIDKTIDYIQKLYQSAAI
jgi:glycosyltransferase involved in cell wall biosynthesis